MPRLLFRRPPDESSVSSHSYYTSATPSSTTSGVAGVPSSILSTPVPVSGIRSAIGGATRHAAVSSQAVSQPPPPQIVLTPSPMVPACQQQGNTVQQPSGVVLTPSPLSSTASGVGGNNPVMLNAYARANEAYLARQREERLQQMLRVRVSAVTSLPMPRLQGAANNNNSLSHQSFQTIAIPVTKAPNSSFTDSAHNRPTKADLIDLSDDENSKGKEEVGAQTEHDDGRLLARKATLAPLGPTLGLSRKGSRSVSPPDKQNAVNHCVTKLVDTDPDTSIEEASSSDDDLEDHFIMVRAARLHKTSGHVTATNSIAGTAPTTAPTAATAGAAGGRTNLRHHSPTTRPSYHHQPYKRSVGDALLQPEGDNDEAVAGKRHISRPSGGVGAGGGISPLERLAAAGTAHHHGHVVEGGNGGNGNAASPVELGESLVTSHQSPKGYHRPYSMQPPVEDPHGNGVKKAPTELEAVGVAAVHQQQPSVPLRRVRGPSGSVATIVLSDDEVSSVKTEVNPIISPPSCGPPAGTCINGAVLPSSSSSPEVEVFPSIPLPPHPTARNLADMFSPLPHHPATSAAGTRVATSTISTCPSATVPIALQPTSAPVRGHVAAPLLPIGLTPSPPPPLLSNLLKPSIQSEHLPKRPTVIDMDEI